MRRVSIGLVTAAVVLAGCGGDAAMPPAPTIAPRSLQLDLASFLDR